MSPAERPWQNTLRVAAMTGDAAMARTAIEAGKTQLSRVGPDTIGVRAFMNAMLNYASRDFVGAAREMQEADRRLMVGIAEGALWLALSHDQAGNADSAVAAMERYVARAEPDLWTQSRALAPMSRRLGELYEARGDRVKAIEAYQRVVDLWRNGEPDFQRQAREVQTRIDKLRPPG
jgi:tetratricopeptide (TPR) repeat protein